MEGEDGGEVSIRPGTGLGVGAALCQDGALCGETTSIRALR